MNEEMNFYLQHTGNMPISQMSRQDLKNLVATGESSFLEFKHKVASPEKIAREIAAFANATGGTILIGVADNGELIGTESYMEEEFWLNQAIDLCIPKVEIRMELLNIGNKDIIIIEVPEAETKPVYVKGNKGRKVFIRQGDECQLASEDLIEVLKQGYAEEGVTFEFGENERLLFRYLKEYSDITVKRFSTIINKTTYSAAKILVNLVTIGVLDLYEKDGVAHYTLSKKVSNFTDMSNQEENLDDVIASLLDDLVDEETMADEVQKKSEKPVTLTERAAKQVLKIMTDDQDHNDLYLRVAVEGGGCSGLSYKLGLDYSTENDIKYVNYGVEIIVDEKHLMYLEGITIDYPDGLDARGFTFDNPNAIDNCGCGTSFSI